MERPHPKHHQPLMDWLDRSAQVLQDWEDWKDALGPEDRRTLGLQDFAAPKVKLPSRYRLT